MKCWLIQGDLVDIVGMSKGLIQAILRDALSLSRVVRKMLKLFGSQRRFEVSTEMLSMSDYDLKC